MTFEASSGRDTPSSGAKHLVGGFLIGASCWMLFVYMIFSGRLPPPTDSIGHAVCGYKSYYYHKRAPENRIGSRPDFTEAPCILVTWCPDAGHILGAECKRPANLRPWRLEYHLINLVRGDQFGSYQGSEFGLAQLIAFFVIAVLFGCFASRKIGSFISNVRNNRGLK